MVPRSRKQRVPNKDNLRMFVRASAVRPRVGASNPWVVSQDLVKKYSLPTSLPQPPTPLFVPNYKVSFEDFSTHITVSSLC